MSESLQTKLVQNFVNSERRKALGKEKDNEKEKESDKEKERNQEMIGKTENKYKNYLQEAWQKLSSRNLFKPLNEKVPKN